MAEKWELAFVLPNLRLPDPPSANEYPIVPPLEAGDVAIVPATDSRVVAIASASAAAKKLLYGFVSVTKRQVLPSALIYRASAPPSINTEAMVAFRNAIAISRIVRSWLLGSDDDRLYSDVFDFYPARISRTDRLLVLSPALIELFSDDAPFQGMPAPHICQPPGPLYADYYLDRALKQLWLEHFQEGISDPFHRALFRSLEIAYMALATPFRNQASLYEWGVNLTLWVNALEILAHPAAFGDSGQVGRVDVIDLLGTYTWGRESLSATPYTIEYRAGGKRFSRAVTPIQWACWKLYDVRNDFLHGNAVDPQALRPFSPDGETLVEIAPAIFRTTLFAYLQRRVNPYRGFTDAKFEPSHPSDEHVRHMIEDFKIEMGVERVLGINRTEPDD